MTAWRCFVAVRLDDMLRRQLGAAVDGWRAQPQLGDLRWIDADDWHVTLAFLGATEPAAVATLATGIERAVAGSPTFELTTGGVGAFPTARGGRVAWYGVDDSDRRMAAISTLVREAAGVAASPFHAHVTLARVRNERGADLRDWIAGAAAPIGRIPVAHIELIRSHLGRGPARYETLASLPLGAPVHA